MRARLAFVLFLLCLVSAEAEDERLFVNATINAKPVRLAFDTGTDVGFVIYSRTAKKLGLKVAPPPARARVPPGQIRVGWTATQKVDLGFGRVKTTLAVVDIPEYLKPTEDGLLGWPAVSHNAFWLDCVALTIAPFNNDRKTLEGWVKCRIQPYKDLTLELPRGPGRKEIISFDSGSTYGVELSPDAWRQWKSAHPDQPTTVTAYFTPGAGLVVSEEAWADKISVGQLTMTDTPVMQADSSVVESHSPPRSQFDATLGLAAMKRLDIVIDGKHDAASLRPKATPPLPYEYNHLGAVFVPRLRQSQALLAHVVAGSPAYEAGIRDGDILLKIGELDCTQWQTDTNVLPSMHQTLAGQGGTKLEFTLARAGETLKTVATLRNILSPRSATNSN